MLAREGIVEMMMKTMLDFNKCLAVWRLTDTVLRESRTIYDVSPAPSQAMMRATPLISKRWSAVSLDDAPSLYGWARICAMHALVILAGLGTLQREPVDESRRQAVGGWATEWRGKHCEIYAAGARLYLFTCARRFICLLQRDKLTHLDVEMRPRQVSLSLLTCAHWRHRMFCLSPMAMVVI